MSEVNCIECGKPARIVGGREIYPHRKDLWHKKFWKCQCGAYCGCHPETKKALGYPCGPETRRARSQAHEHFDKLWRGRQSIMSRKQAYAGLSHFLQVPKNRCHIGMMDKETAEKVPAACIEIREKWMGMLKEEMYGE